MSALSGLVRRSCRAVWSGALVACATTWVHAGAQTAASTPTLELGVVAGTRPLKINQLGQTHDARQRALAVSRLDLLLADFSLQRADGSWTPADGWHAFFQAEQPARRQALPAVAPGRYVGARFVIGVGPQANHADPNRLGPDDPLHPIVNGMHWGWTGGYIFTALEGHWQYDHAPAGSTGGFSYHLAGDDNRIAVTLKQPLQVRADSVLRLTLDASRLLARVDIARDGESTHSRGQDAVVVALKQALGSAFSIGVAGPSAPVASTAPARATSASPPYRLVVGAHMPTLAWPEDNTPTVAGVALGQRLFNDTRLSRDGSVSCATCHRAGHALADGGRALSGGIGGQLGTRNSMPLFNLGWGNEFFWDGRIKGLRHQVLDPIQHPKEMAQSLPALVATLAADPDMTRRFRQAFGGPVTVERIGLALEQFLLTQVSQDSKFDRVMKNADRFTPAEKRGFDLFLTEHDPATGLRGGDCFHCHGGALFTNQRFMNNGLPLRGGDLGREQVTGDASDRGKFRTPSLRNVAITAPYMHDGRFRTLEEVIAHYDHGMERSATLDPNLAKHPKEGLRLSAEDQAALVAFLRTLTDPAFAAPPPRSTASARSK